MEISAEFRGEICILRLRGRFTIGTTRDFERSKAAISNRQPAVVLVDLEEVPYVDSTGIAYLLGFHTSLTRDGKRFGILHTNKRIREVLKLCRLDRIMALFPSEEAALSALAPGSGPKSRQQQAGVDWDN